jgi:ATP-binding cassette subfamily B protein
VRRPKLGGEVRFERVSFRYEKPQEPVLRDVSLTVRSGQCVAILGATGAGKSALMGLIPRFYDPTAGRLLLDGIDARQIELDDLRHNIGIVFQESFLFSNTIAANIAFGHPDATPEQIERAARIAAAHGFITAMPQGYDTVLSESGISLSGGQRQRLAIARAVLLEPAILLLDDPTAAIDSETEHEIFQALENAISGRTTFIVAHRLSTLRRADFIIVLEHGRIVQQGTHAELMRQAGPYLRVASLQLVDNRELRLLAEQGGAA